MPNNIFGAGDDRQVDAHRCRLQKKRRCPGIVDQRDDLAGLCDRNNRGHVLHFKGQTSRRLHENGSRGWCDQRLDPATDQRIIISRRDPALCQIDVAQSARRIIGSVSHQQMITRTQHAQQRPSNSRRTRRIEHGARGTGIERCQRIGKRPLRRGPPPAIKPIAIAIGLQTGFQRGRVVIQYRRGAPHRRIDSLARPFLATTALNQCRRATGFVIVAQSTCLRRFVITRGRLPWACPYRHPTRSTIRRKPRPCHCPAGAPRMRLWSPSHPIRTSQQSADRHRHPQQ